MNLKVLSWNILQGGGTRINAIANSIIAIQPNFVLLSEFKNNLSGKKLMEMLAANGYTFLYFYETNTTENSVLIASKMEGIMIDLTYDISEEFLHNVISVNFSGFALTSVYLPHKKKHKLFNTLNNLVSDQSLFHIIAGDFNTGINYIDQLGNSFWYEEDFKNICMEKLKDGFRYKHQDIQEYSWFSHQKNGFRYDHTLIDTRIVTLVSECKYLHDYRINKISDHSPMLLSIKP
jgi:exodeoxyribonuclease III